MVLEQLLSPEVLDWAMRKQTNTLLEGESSDFNTWLIENEDKINKSVEDNIEIINECIINSIKEVGLLSEGLFDEIKNDNDTDEESDEDDDDLFKTVDSTTVNKQKKRFNHNITNKQRLSNEKGDSLSSTSKNVFVAVNALNKRLKDKKMNRLANSDIWSSLDVSNVVDMRALFAFADAPEADLSSWDVSAVKHMEGMFYKSTFNNDSLNKWTPSNCADFKNMFAYSSMSYNLDSWKNRTKMIEIRDRNDDGSAKTTEIRKGQLRGDTVYVHAPIPKIGLEAIDELRETEEYWSEWIDDIEYRAREREEMEMKNKTKNKHITESKNMKNIMDFDTFVNEGFVDNIKKGIKNIKNAIKNITLKISDYFVASFDENKMLNVISPYTTLNYLSTANVPGVKVASKVNNDLINDNVNTTIDFVESPEYYGIIEKDSLEYRNYLTFNRMLNEHYEKYGDFGAFSINEGKRVGFKSEMGGLRDAKDISTEELKELLRDSILNVPAYIEDDEEEPGGAILIWGAPGIGKSTIPKTIIKEWNDNHAGKKALLTVECGDLTVDGFTLPIPVHKKIASFLSSRPETVEKLKQEGIDIQKYADNIQEVSTESPKTWLPCFRPTADNEETKLLNEIANGYVNASFNKNLKTSESTEGGIIMFDEFFRADESIFHILMQIILNRNYNGEFVLGNKWAIIACSNRPEDDDQVSNRFEKTGAVVGTRFVGQYNLIPDFDVWKSWAVDKGHFDVDTINFLTKEKDGSGEYTNWHTIRPDDYIKGKTMWPTPRTWSKLMNEIHKLKRNRGYSSIFDIPKDKLFLLASGAIGVEMATTYVQFIDECRNNKLDVNELLTNPNYNIDSSMTATEVTNKISSYIKTIYSKNKLPQDTELCNMFDVLVKTYPTNKDNLLKEMHINIIKQLGANVDDSAAQNELRNYVIKCIKKYSIKSSDFK